MKLCPACQRCYEDSDAVCSFDSTGLVASRHGSCTIAEKYHLDRLLGRGGMGAVYEGTHVDLDRPVAIKLLLPDFTADPEALERFRREARAAARLNHPNVADTYDYGSLPEGGAYIIMELIDGDTLRERMDAVGKLPFGEAIRIARQVTNGVEAAHRHNITHRDLKPSNIILTRDHDGRMLAKVVDFSVAKLKEGTTSGTALTATGSLIGTPRYMAPEQCADNKTDARSDIYSLGVILYEMIAGRAPFEGPTTTAIAIKHIQMPPPPVEEFRPDTPPVLRSLIEQSLAKLPSERPQTAQEFAAKLDEAAIELPQDERLEQSSASANNEAQDSGERRAAPETNRQKIDNDPSTRRAGEPTLEDSISREVINPPSVQSYAIQTGELDEELETKVSAKEPDKGSEPRDGKAVAGEMPPTGSPEAERKKENSFPLLSEHSKAAPSTPQDSKTDEAAEAVASTPPRSNLLPFIVAAALLLVVGLGISLFVFKGTSGSGETGNRSAAIQNGNAAPTANGDGAVRTDNQPAVSNAGASPSPTASTGDARSELQSFRDEWIEATRARNLNRLMAFYPPVVETFYLKRNVPRSAVRAEKQRMMEQASSIELTTGQPETNLSADGRSATMTFRKSWNFRGALNSSGEVIQELRWAKTAEGWKIVSERDIGVLR
ncbi:MAG TPA: serine/threonine-protein kinase [Pyrinomonadaceae bacterium]|jgi:serine/threonine protein kinase/ketosteroid isomerase-like protein